MFPTLANWAERSFPFWKMRLSRRRWVERVERRFLTTTTSERIAQRTLASTNLYRDDSSKLEKGGCYHLKIGVIGLGVVGHALVETMRMFMKM